MKQHKIRDAMIYAGVSILVMAGIILWALYVPANSGISAKILRLTVATAILYGYIVRWYWKMRNSIRFWLIISGFIVLHLFSFQIILRNMQNIPLFWFILPCLFEGGLIMLVLNFILHVSPP